MSSQKPRHINIPIFIPHLGCPNNCVFCNQRSISGHGDFDITSVQGEIETALATVERDCELGEYECEIAFFGGSFTGIDRADMLYLLGLAEEYVKAERVRSIRLSTRPDYIDSEILDILARYSVKHIELGLQSLCDRVLAASKRGHTSARAIEACELIRSRGFGLTGQMMIALPESTAQDELYTARRIASLCDSARIYPTVVFRETELARQYLRGDYTPPPLDEVITRTAACLEVFIEASKPVLRIGLHSSDNLSDPSEAIAGAIHPALGELVSGELCYARLARELEKSSKIGDVCARGAVKSECIRIEVPPAEVSKVIGQHRGNILRLEAQFGVRVRVVGSMNALSIFAPEWRLL